jgi:hypothetical protein
MGLFTQTGNSDVLPVVKDTISRHPYEDTRGVIN